MDEHHKLKRTKEESLAYNRPLGKKSFITSLATFTTMKICCENFNMNNSIRNESIQSQIQYTHTAHATGTEKETVIKSEFHEFYKKLND